jgi:hypothetical protein
MVIILLLFREIPIIFECLREETVPLVTLTPPNIYMLVQGQTVLLGLAHLAVVVAVPVVTPVMEVTAEHVLAAHFMLAGLAGHMAALLRVVAVPVVTAVPAQVLIRVVVQVATAPEVEAEAVQALIIRHPREAEV